MPKSFAVDNPLFDKFESTPNGMAITLRVYVYPRGGGYIAHPKPEPSGRNISVPADSLAHLVGNFAMLVDHGWHKAAKADKLRKKNGLVYVRRRRERDFILIRDPKVYSEHSNWVTQSTFPTEAEALAYAESQNLRIAEK